MINHEKIHLKQQQELLIVFFYIFYLTEWLVRTAIYFDSYKAYQNVSFEREAYDNEKNLDYVRQRKTFGFFKYLLG